MKQKLLLAFTAMAMVFMSCNGDEIDDLEKRLKRVENNLGNQPVKFNFSTTDYDDQNVTKNAAYYFQSSAGSTHYLYDRGEGIYEVYVERFSDVYWNSYARVEFTYNSTTGEVSYPYVQIYFENPDRNINAYFQPCCQTENDVTISVKSFDATTGKIALTVHATTTTNSQNNVYGNPMTLDLSFRGTLGVFTWENTGG